MGKATRMLVAVGLALAGAGLGRECGAQAVPLPNFKPPKTGLPTDVVTLAGIPVAGSTSRFTRAIVQEVAANSKCAMEGFAIGEMVPVEVGGRDFYGFESNWSCVEEDQASRWWSEVGYRFYGEIVVPEGVVPSLEARNFRISELGVQVSVDGGGSLP